MNVLISNQEEYNDIMVDLESRGYLWNSGDNPTSLNVLGRFMILLSIDEVTLRLSYHDVTNLSSEPDYLTFEEYKKQFILRKPIYFISIEDFLNSPSPTTAVRLPDYNTFRKFVSLLTPTQKAMLSEYWEKLSYKIFKEFTCITSSLNLVKFNDKLEIKRILL